uniref:Voltage-dependent calcium channel alpha-2/delta subunit conserved region domain-containing protein n=1 Tax=Ditylenchus dipsaci TaxID=166011 RepID=A0A915DEZ1_9BILA
MVPRYCLLNDSDVELNAEAAFTAYARQMRSSGEMPSLCRDRRKLVDRLLLDLQATASFNSIWDMDWQKNRDNGVHLTFLATPSGLIRFMNQSLGDLFYEHPEGFAENNTEFAYKHFVLELNKKTTEEEYFKRAVRQRGKIVFDINRQTRVWQNADQQSAYGNVESETLLGLAYKAVYVDDALVGVVGMEFLYDKLAEKMKQLGCTPDDEHTRCFLLDEHAYVVYTSQKDTLYSDFIKANTWHSSVANTTQGRRRRPATRQMAQQLQQQQRQKLEALASGKAMHQSVVLGSFFGHINRVAEWTMELLVKKGFYTETTFTDNQAMCDPEPIVLPVTGSATIAKRLYSGFSPHFPANMGPSPANAFTTSFKPTVEGRYSCKAKSKFYIANPTDHRKGSNGQSAALLEENYSERPCEQNAAQCAVKVFASWVHSTNLLLVVVKQGSRSQCYDNNHCAMSVPPSLSFGFHKIEANFYGDSNEEEEEIYEYNRDALASRPNQGRRKQTPLIECSVSLLCQKEENVVQCLRDDFLEDESELACSNGPRTQYLFSLQPVLLIMLMMMLHRILLLH